jgi:hypothetical protein
MTIPAKEEDRSAQDWGGRARAANDGTRSNWRKLTMRRAQADMPGRGKATPARQTWAEERKKALSGANAFRPRTFDFRGKSLFARFDFLRVREMHTAH